MQSLFNRIFVHSISSTVGSKVNFLPMITNFMNVRFTYWLIYILTVLTLCVCFLFIRPTQRLNRVAVEILESRHTANVRGQVFVTETDSTSSVCPPSSWWARKTSPVRKTTSGLRRNPAAFVSPPPPPSFHIHARARGRESINMDVCADERRKAMHNEWSDYPRSLPGEALDFLKQWEHLLVN